MTELQHHQGTLELIIGPMFSGKSTQLNEILTEFADNDLNVLKINHVNDVRPDLYGTIETGSTHNSSFRSLTEKITCCTLASLTEAEVDAFHVIGIDEGQFFPDLYDVVQDWVNRGYHVRVAGLDGDSKMQPFGQILSLIPLSDSVTKKHARCFTCLTDLKKNGFKGNIMAIQAAFTRRIVPDSDQVLIGGAKEYIPVCRYHFFH